MAVARHEIRLSCCKLGTHMCPIPIEWRRMPLTGTCHGQRATWMDRRMVRKEPRKFQIDLSCWD
jgi:hypothetical protein